MHLKTHRRNKDGKEHRYFSVVENRRLRTGKMTQRQALYLGEINDSQQAAWRKTLAVFVESEQRFTELSLFPEDRDLPCDAVNSIQIKLDQMELHRPRAWGNCWLGCELWRHGTDVFARRVLALLARHGLADHVGIFLAALEVAVQADPVHLAAALQLRAIAEAYHRLALSHWSASTSPRCCGARACAGPL